MLNEALDIKYKDKIAIIGSGGKTTFAYNLAKQNQDKITILTTSTKMYEVKDINFNNLYNQTSITNLKKGVNLCGKIIDNKVNALDDFSDFYKNCDLFIYEADGAKELPYKVWKNNEPVILENTNKIIGIIPLHLLNYQLNENFIHRFDDFLQVFEVSKNDVLSIDLIEKICLKMFENISLNSDNFIFFNRCDDLKVLNELAKRLKNFRLLAGFLKEEKYIRLNF
ncbi:putative selenium-dependent hydroxylase accessory protein YqeC [Campylobacter sp. RM12640]|uniref:selenium cofactor biosynthesis protein YqeC n=1 Tax=unclassified Campylobacter TaxID=2593542 RepID=UPI003014536A|nr:putative selenium-dependent hydroxylase accessory protein YqeC [Campylobacter sp. RM12640]MBZ7989899.1 putative selenium-dependent hydroxylase accessory protein YqeC [Campylobacter sp. RM12635]